MKNALFFLIFSVCLLNWLSLKANTGKRQFLYTYDDAGNRIKREFTVICPTCRMAQNDSTKIVDSLFTLAQNTPIEAPPVPTEKTITDGMPQLRNVYPNPTKGDLIMQFSDLVHATLQIFDTYGNKVDEIPLDGLEFQINIAMLPSGEYTLFINRNDGKVFSKKIIKI